MALVGSIDRINNRESSSGVSPLVVHFVRLAAPVPPISMLVNRIEIRLVVITARWSWSSTVNLGAAGGVVADRSARKRC